MSTPVGPTNQSTLLPLGLYSIRKNSTKRLFSACANVFSGLLYLLQETLLIFVCLVLQNWWINVSDLEFTLS